jgi:carboxylesterase
MNYQEAVAPFSAHSDPSRTGGRSLAALLIHGFTGSPAAMKPWAHYLSEHGVAVEVPRLPGHGTTWRDMNRTTWGDWYGKVEATFDQLSAAHDAVVVCGLSMGGALTLRLAANRSDAISGLVLVNPAVNSLRKDVALLPVLKHVIPALPGIAGSIKKPDANEFGYGNTPLKAAHSMFQAWAELRADLANITAPILYFRSDVDPVVDNSSQQIIADSVSSQEFELRMLSNSYHVATLDYDAQQIFEESLEFITRVTEPRDIPHG